MGMPTMIKDFFRGFLDIFAGFFERLGWSPRIAELLVIVLIIGAVSKIFALRVRI